MSLLQFLLQFTLVAGVLLIPGMLLGSLGQMPAKPRVSLRGRFILILLVAAALSASPWNSTVLN